MKKMKKLDIAENSEFLEKDLNSAGLLSKKRQKKVKTKSKSKLSFSFSKMMILVRMLLQDKLKISFKANKKRAIIKIVSLVIIFAVLCAISFAFYEICILLNIFSVLKYVPLTVPSFLMAILFVLNIVSAIFGLTKTLYYSEDNKIMVTYPCSGSTIYFARLITYFVNEYIKNFTIQIPLLIGFMVVMGAPIYTYVGLFIAFIFISAFEVLLAALISIPMYYITLFLKRHNLVRTLVVIVLYLAALAFVVWLVLLIPDELDIFTNWGPYWNAMMSFLNGYKTYASPLYYLTMMAVGYLNGFSYKAFCLEGLYTFLVVIGAIAILFIVSIFVINPIYFKLSTSSFEFETKVSKVRQMNIKHGYIYTQLKKEILLFGEEGSTILSFLGSFVLLPLIIMLINKIFGGMNTNSLGNILVQIVNLLVMMLIALNANTAIASAFSKEGNAFFMDRTYPKRSYYLLLSKMICPMVIGTISLLLSGYIYYNFYGASHNMTYAYGLLLSIGVIFFYIGHMLYSAGLDFTNLSSNFINDGSTPKSVKSSTLLGFVLAILMVVLFYFFLTEETIWAYAKVILFGFIYLGVNIVLFIYKAKLLFKEGNLE